METREYLSIEQEHSRREIQLMYNNKYRIITNMSQSGVDINQYQIGITIRINN